MPLKQQCVCSKARCLHFDQSYLCTSTLCKRAAKALASICIYVKMPEHSLHTDEIITENYCSGVYVIVYNLFYIPHDGGVKSHVPSARHVKISFPSRE